MLPDRRITFAEADRASRALAKRMLAAGIGKGTRVGLFYTYSVEWVVTWLAASRIGALVMPFSTIYAPGELRTVLRLGRRVHPDPGADPARTGHGRLSRRGRPRAARTAEESDLFLPDLPYLRSIWMTGRRTGRGPGGCPSIRRPRRRTGQRRVAERRRGRGGAGRPGDRRLHVRLERPAQGRRAHARVDRADDGALRGDARRRPAAPCSAVSRSSGSAASSSSVGPCTPGLTVCCLERFEPEAALDMVEKEGCGMVAAWPSLIQSMRTHPTFPGRNLEHCPMLVSGPSDVALIDTPVPGIPGHRGMSETVGNWNGVERKIVDPDRRHLSRRTGGGRAAHPRLRGDPGLLQEGAGGGLRRRRVAAHRRSVLHRRQSAVLSSAASTR